MAVLCFSKEPEKNVHQALHPVSHAARPVGLGRKLSLPFWWVQSFVLNTLQKQSCLNQFSEIVLPPLSSRILLPILEMWDAAVEQSNTAPDARRLLLPIPTNEILQAELIKYWAAPLCFKDQTSLNVVASSRLVDAEGKLPTGQRHLELNLTISLAELCTGRFMRAHGQVEVIGAQNFPQLIHMNPNVLRALGAAPAAQRVASYLEFECLKACQSKPKGESEKNSIVVSMPVETLAKRHKNMMRDSKLFYDLGCVQWEAHIPAVAIASLGRSGVKVLWSLPQQQPQHSQQLQPYPQQQYPQQQQLPLSQPHSSASLPHLANVSVSAPGQTRPEVDVPHDLDFLIQVAAFYESLNGQQRQALERQREFLTDEQFKEFVVPLMKAHQKNSVKPVS